MCTHYTIPPELTFGPAAFVSDGQALTPCTSGRPLGGYGDGLAPPPLPNRLASLLERRCGAGWGVTRKNPPPPSDGLACRSWRYAKDRRSALPISRQGGDRRGHRGTRSLVLLPSFEKRKSGRRPQRPDSRPFPTARSAKKMNPRSARIRRKKGKTPNLLKYMKVRVFKRMTLSLS